MTEVSFDDIFKELESGLSTPQHDWARAWSKFRDAGWIDKLKSLRTLMAKRRPMWQLRVIGHTFPGLGGAVPVEVEIVYDIDRRRSAADEDFLALFATEMAERIKANATVACEASASDRFLRLLRTTCDTVRHRIVRAAHRRSLTHEQSAFIEQVPAAIQEPPDASELIQKLMQSLDLDEHLLVSHYLDGDALEAIAASLGWSRRTAYRRLDAVIKKLRQLGEIDGGHD